jgi:stage IV sporulation protein FB
LLAVFLIIKGQAIFLVNSTLVVLLHEMAHARAAYGRGYVMNSIVLMPYGAVLYGEEAMRRNDAIFIALAGPVFNLFIAVVFFALWWLIPELYAYTDTFVYSNVSIALFNLLPVFPLDGSRVLLGLAKNKTKTLKLLRLLGLIVASAMFVFFIFSAFFDINVTAGIMAVFLYSGAVMGTKKEMYEHISKNISVKKNFYNGVEKKTFYVCQDIKLVRLLKMLNENSLITFAVVDNNSKIIKTLEETALGELLIKNDADTPLKEALAKNG